MWWVAVSDTSEGDDLETDHYEIQRAILRDDAELAIDFNAGSPTDAPFVYTILLHRFDRLIFRGRWSAGKRDEKISDTCTCRLYSSGDRLAFVGAWKQEGVTQQWIGELIPVEAFDDER